MGLSARPSHAGRLQVLSGGRSLLREEGVRRRGGMRQTEPQQPLQVDFGSECGEMETV